MPIPLLCVQFVNNAALVGSAVTVVHHRAVAVAWIGLGRVDETFRVSECSRPGRESADQHEENNNERDGGGCGGAAAAAGFAGLVHGRVDAHGCLCHRQGSTVVSMVVLLFRIHSFLFSISS